MPTLISKVKSVVSIYIVFQSHGFATVVPWPLEFHETSTTGVLSLRGANDVVFVSPFASLLQFQVVTMGPQHIAS